MKRKYIIGVSGDSGVGKTTLSNLISYLFNENNVLLLSGDDLHKWERNNPNWKTLTHFNPETNNLDFGWDGSYGLEGTDALPGSYTYKINIKVPDNDDRVIITGHVNLIR